MSSFEICDGVKLTFLDRLDLRYTFPRYTDLQSLVKCLDLRGTVLILDTVCSQARVVLGLPLLASNSSVCMCRKRRMWFPTVTVTRKRIVADSEAMISCTS